MSLPRALVVEDERPARDYLATLLERSGRVQVVGGVATAADARAVLAEELELAFVDIQLAGPESGLAVARWLYDRGLRTACVLTTASRAHALDAYDAGVADYLVKPVTPRRLAECLDRIAPRLPPREAAPPEAPRRLVARQGSALVFLAAGEALAFEASGRLVTAHTTRGRFDVDLSLNALAACLGDGVARVHRSWLVRLDEVRRLVRLDGEVVLEVGEAGLRVPVAADRQAAVRAGLLARAVGLRER